VSEKYTTLESPPNDDPRILTSDVYLAAYLLTQDCRLAEVLRNERHRVSFVVEGEGADRLRRNYKSGPVYVNVRFFREKLLSLRRLMDGKQRSASCPTPPSLPLSQAALVPSMVEGSPMQLSRA